MLRDYQIDAINQIEKVFESDNRCMLQMDTGSGKTFTFCELAKRFFLTEIKKTIIIVHRKELLEQTHKSLGERCFIIKAGVSYIPSNFDYYVGMVESVYNREDILPDFGLVIIDEAHVGNFNKLSFFYNENVKILGVSATPKSSNENKLSDLYKNIVIPTNISTLIRTKYLVDCESYGYKTDFVNAQDFSVSRGDYVINELSDFYSGNEMVQTTIESYWKKCAGKQTIVFNVNIAHNQLVAEALRNEGLNVYLVDSTINAEERDDIISSFKRDKHGIMCNVGVLTTGFDCPSIECIILNRATKSLTLYLQMIGRGARPFENKENFTLIDLGGNVARHGMYSEHRDWVRLFQYQEVSGDGVAPVKECPSCGYIMHTRTMICPSCNYVFPKKTPRERMDEVLVLLNKEDPLKINMQSLFHIGDYRGWKPYAYPYKIAEHLINYQKKHLDTVSDDMLLELGEEFYFQWLKKIKKRNSEWNRNFFREAINKIQEKENITNKAIKYKEDDGSTDSVSLL